MHKKIYFSFLILFIAMNSFAGDLKNYKNEISPQKSENMIITQEIKDKAYPPDLSSDERTMAIILGIVSVAALPFGLHNWYIGKNRRALIQTLMIFPGFILILPFMISWVWQIIDLIKILQ